MKWTRYGADVLPLWVAESDFVTCPAVVDAVQAAVSAESTLTPRMLRSLRAAESSAEAGAREKRSLRVLMGMGPLELGRRAAADS